MPELTIEQTFAKASDHHQAGRLREAETLYRQILSRQPGHVSALHHLGLIAAVTGHKESAVDLIRKAITLRPDLPKLRNNLGNVLKDLGRLDEAIAEYRRAIEIDPNYPQACFNLANAFSAAGAWSQAIAAYQQAIKLDPNWPPAHNSLGAALKAFGKTEEAIASFRQAIALKPKYPSALNNLGIALREMGRIDESIEAYQQAIEIDPSIPELHNNLGNSWKEKGRSKEAVAAYREAIALRPGYAEAYSNLGASLRNLGDIDEAIAAFRQAAALNPRHYDAYNNLGVALKDAGLLDEAIVAYRQAIAIMPDGPGAFSNLLYTIHFHPGYDARAIAGEHRQWNLSQAEPLKKYMRPPSIDRSENRRLRIGYVSPDFVDHAVAFFFEPVLESHDRSAFEIFAYAQVTVPDGMTRRLQAAVDVWRNIYGQSDEEVADLIRRDQIDILVDLTMHMSQNRMLVFARKPAPIQVTYLAYCSTTGLETIDYRLSDPYLDPPGGDESVYTEKTIRLPETYWCYQPEIADPGPVGPVPAIEKGYVTFGCLNNFCKVTEAALAVWAEILRAVPNSRLLLHARQGGHRQRVQTFFAERGIAPDRIHFAGFVPVADYFALYRQIDIALDTFPYGGGTTTCDGLWMGVPIITLAGKTAVGRGGESILSNLNLREYIAPTEDEYVRLAVELAGDMPRLAGLRATLRSRMESSPLTNALRFTQAVEESFRQMWATLQM